MQWRTSLLTTVAASVLAAGMAMAQTSPPMGAVVPGGYTLRPETNTLPDEMRRAELMHNYRAGPAGTSSGGAMGGTSGGSDSVPDTVHKVKPGPTPMQALRKETLQDQIDRAVEERNKSPGLAGPAHSASGGIAGGTSGGVDTVPHDVQWSAQASTRNAEMARQLGAPYGSDQYGMYRARPGSTGNQ